MLNPVLAMAIGIVVMMVLIIFTKMHAFPSLIISAILIAVLAMPFGPEGATVATLTECVSTVTKGFGNTMASIGVVIGFGCIMGIFLEKSGAAKRMALTILKMCKELRCGSWTYRLRSFHSRILRFRFRYPVLSGKRVFTPY